jgi:endonuclease/exonuclease/phosphatase (EEP) superfamily protein YafD
MPHKNLNLFWKIVITLFIGGIGVIMCGRNHFILGTALIIFRWAFLLFGLAILYLMLKRTTPKQFKVWTAIALLIIPLEYTWNKINEENLKSGLLSTEVSLMTYNVFFKNSSPNSSLNKIKNYDPDILFIQELTPEWKVNLENSIGRKYPYRRTSALQGTHGIGVYSKFPIIDSELLNNNNLPFAQIVELSINNKKVQLINVHLASPAIAVEDPENFMELFSSNYKLRSQQLENINTVAIERENEFNAQILIGDLNTTPYEPIYRDIKKHWVNLYDLAGNGCGFNFPNSNKVDPILILDYIFGRGVVKGIEMKVMKGGSSDHLALVGRIKI